MGRISERTKDLVMLCDKFDVTPENIGKIASSISFEFADNEWELYLWRSNEWSYQTNQRFTTADVEATDLVLKFEQDPTRRIPLSSYPKVGFFGIGSIRDKPESRGMYLSYSIVGMKAFFSKREKLLALVVE